MILAKIKSWIGLSDNDKVSEPKASSTKTGTVKYFNRKKGYGFIQSQQLLKDVFVHIRDLNDRVRKGDRVEFEIERNEKGLKAVNVHLVNS